MMLKALFSRLIVAAALFATGCSPERGDMRTGSLEEIFAPPNIVLIYLDDFGWKDLTANGAEYFRTPNIDYLVNHGAWFSQAYANAPNCAPSRASLMTGTYTPRHGVFTVDSAARGESRFRRVVPPENETQLDPEEFTLADALKLAGYTTGIVGKWHLGTVSPREYGFDVSIAANDYGTPPSYYAPYENNGDVLQDLSADAVEGEYLTDRLTDEAIEFIETNRSRRFFLLLSHYAVHVPLQAKPEVEAKYLSLSLANESFDPTYAAMIESVDQSVGRILTSLDENALNNNTLVIFLSDNGPFGPASDAKPLRGSKGMLYEGGIRVPMVWYWPGRIAEGISIDLPVIGTDIFPTLLSFAQKDGIGTKILDGVDLYRLLIANDRFDDRNLYWHFPAYLERYDGDPYVTSPWRTGPVSAIRYGDWKLIEFLDSETAELYDLSKDMSETSNVSRRYPDVTNLLLEMLESWRNDTDAPMPLGPNPEFDQEALARFNPDLNSRLDSGAGDAD